MNSIKLSRYRVELEDSLDVEYVLEEITPEENTASLLPEEMRIETNQAFNEAERYISELENNRSHSKMTEDKLKAMNSALENTTSNTELSQLKIAENVIEEAQKKMQQNQDSFHERSQSSNKKTTISYSLVNRSAFIIPNPVYTCSSNGKVVISIEVNSIGKVVKATYNRSASTTTNVCLIEAALEYAAGARFSPDENRSSQIGTITYNYPGQTQGY